MASHGAELTLSHHIPNPDCVVSTARGQQAAIATKSDLSDAFAVTFEHADLAATGNVPKHDLADGFEFYVLHHVLRIRSRRGILLLPFLSWAEAAHRHQIQIRLGVNSARCQRAPVGTESDGSN